MGAVAPKLRLYMLLALVPLVFGGVAQAKVVVPLKSETDTREFRHIELDNGLQVLLIRDEEEPVAAVAASVRAGAYQDPDEWPGLAHLLLHTILSGKSQGENGQGANEGGTFKTWLSSHGGAVQPNISGEYAHYQFTITPVQLESALMRLAQQLAAPEIDAQVLERSRGAVRAAYQSAAEDPEHRLEDVYRALFSPRHPAAKPVLGNQDILQNAELGALQDALESFHKRWYWPGRTALVVSGPQSLDQLQSMVESAFSAWVEGEGPKPARLPSWFSDDALPLQVNVRSQSGQRFLSLMFPLPSERDHYTRKPLSYIAHNLRREDEGSVLALLRDLGWAEALEAQVRMEAGQEALFEIRVELTDLGQHAVVPMVTLLFYQIGQLERTILAEWRYLELQQMAALAFRFKPEDSARKTVAELAPRLHHYSPEDVLSGDYLYDQFDAGLIRRALRRMRPTNALVTLVTPDVAGESTSDQFQVPYEVNKLDPRQPELKAQIKKRLFPTQPNPFIPQRVLVKEPPLLPSPGAAAPSDTPRPELIFNHPRTRVWFQQDRRFNSPKASLNLRLTLPLVAAGQSGAARAELFAALVQDRLRHLKHPAEFAGLEFSVSAHPQGLDVRVYGYAARQSLLLSYIVKAIRTGRFEEERFAQVHAALLHRLAGQEESAPPHELAIQVPRLHVSPYWTGAELQTQLVDETLENMHRFADAMLQNAHITGLFYGNLYRQEAMRLAAMVQHQLGGEPSRRELVSGRVYRLSESGGPHLYRHPAEGEERSLMLYVQALESSVEDDAHMQLLRRTAEATFHGPAPELSLDVRRELIPMPLPKLDGILFAVHSPSAPGAAMVAHVQSFLSAHSEYLEAELGAHQDALARELRAPADSLRQQSEYYWNSVLKGDWQFNRRAQLADAVEQVSVESLQRYFDRAARNPEAQLWLATSALELPNEFRTVDGIEEYRENQQNLTFP